MTDTDGTVDPATRAALAAVVADRFPDARGPIDIDSSPSRYASTATTRLVTVREGGVVLLRAFCKSAPEGGGYRRGVAYEAAVYREILGPLRADVPAYLGAWDDPLSTHSCLAVEYVPSALRVSKSPDANAMPRAAAWLGALHRRIDVVGLTAEQRDLLQAYDADYLGRWFDLAAPFVRAASGAAPGVAELLDLRSEIVALLTSDLTLVHGDFYPDNVLVRGSDIAVVDWESAAIGAGEIDLASLTERWSEDVTSSCLAAYSDSRWDSRPSVDLLRRHVAARLYHLIRVPGLAEVDAASLQGQRRIRRVESALARLRSYPPTEPSPRGE